MAFLRSCSYSEVSCIDISEILQVKGWTHIGVRVRRIVVFFWRLRCRVLEIEMKREEYCAPLFSVLRAAYDQLSLWQPEGVVVSSFMWQGWWHTYLVLFFLLVRDNETLQVLGL